MKKPILAAALLLGLAAGPFVSTPALAVGSTSAMPAAQTTEVQATEVTGPATDGASPAPTDTAGTIPEAPLPSEPVSPSPSDTAAATSPPETTPSDTTSPAVTPPPSTPSPSTPPPATAPPAAPKPIAVPGPIGAKWQAMKGAAGVLGAPRTSQFCGGGLCHQIFRGGNIYWTAKTGAHPVLRNSGHTGPAWYAGGTLPTFGYPTTDEVAAPGGTIQRFATGRILAWIPKGVYQVRGTGGVGRYWIALGAEKGLGLPINREFCGLKGGGCAQAFAKGNIYWSPATGARIVTGVINQRWRADAGHNGALGYPVANQVCGQPAGGCLQRFQGGTIYWSPATGAWASRGVIGTKYASMGASRSSLGYPTARLRCAGSQCVQSFQRGYIGWTSTAGVRVYAMTECSKLNNGRSKYPTHGANRVLLTFTQGYGQSRATNIYCVRMAGLYVADWKTDGYVGASGFKPPGVPSGPTRYLYSPTGSFSVTEAFGLGNPGTKLPYRTLNPRSRWGGNPWTATYNKYFESSSWVGWDENMWYFATRATHDYRQGVVINYNRPNIVQDAGFAIFLHMNKVPTAGCISLDDWAVVDYMRKATPGDRIIMGTYSALFR